MFWCGAEAIALLSFDLLQNPKPPSSFLVTGISEPTFPLDQSSRAVLLEGLSCLSSSRSLSLPGCLSWDFFLLSCQLLFPVDNKQSSAFAVLTCHFTHSQMTAQALEKAKAAAEF